MRSNYCGDISEGDVGSLVSLCGWVHTRRDHGGVIFIDLRDVRGKVQIVFDPSMPETFAVAERLRNEFVLRVKGTVRYRPEGTVNEDLVSGRVEVLIEDLNILNESSTPPFPIDSDESNPETRLKFRYIDLRGTRVKDNLILRAKVCRFIREFLETKNFIEVETPILTKATPEGARDYLVPSRTQPGHFFALPQSPQLFKQLLMIAGLDRYFQIVKCFRDEDLRADRQPEFTQLDIEMSFIGEEEIVSLMEDMVRSLFLEAIKVELPSSFEKITYEDALLKYGTDRPDLRNPLKLVEIKELVRNTSFNVFSSPASQLGGRVVAMNVPGGGSLTRKQIDAYTDLVVSNGAQGLAYIKVQDKKLGLDGLQSPILKFFDLDVINQILEKTSSNNGDLLFFGAGLGRTVNLTMAALRDTIAKDLDLITEEWCPCWVVDFPLFEIDDKDHLSSLHHPFTAPCQEIDEVEKAPEEARSRAYDLVINGYEVGGGSIRINKSDIQKRIFKLLGLNEAEVEEKFAFFTDALDYGCPPHGGIAFGVDRLVMLMAKEDSIREVIAFPKTQTATCPLTKAPGATSKKNLSELNLSSTAKIKDL